jgi:hypothetical protein
MIRSSTIPARAGAAVVAETAAGASAAPPPRESAHHPLSEPTAGQKAPSNPVRLKSTRRQRSIATGACLTSKVGAAPIPFR